LSKFIFTSWFDFGKLKRESLHLLGVDWQIHAKNRGFDTLRTQKDLPIRRERYHCSKRILIFKEFFDPDCRLVWENHWQNFGCFHSQCLFVEAVGRLRNVDEFHIRNGVIVTDHSTVLFLSVDNRRIALSRNGPNDVFVAGRSIHGFVISTFFLDTETNLW